MQHLTSEGDMMPNKDKYQKFVRLKCSVIIHQMLVFWLHTYWGGDSVWNRPFCIFQTSVTLTIDRVIWHTLISRVSHIDLYLHIKFR